MDPHHARHGQLRFRHGRLLPQPAANQADAGNGSPVSRRHPFGTALVILGTAATLLAALVQWCALRDLARGNTPRTPRLPLSIAVSLAVSLLFAALLWELLRR
jgi:uncharacterized membrane protein YidH (DUF202 family)